MGNLNRPPFWMGWSDSLREGRVRWRDCAELGAGSELPELELGRGCPSSEAVLQGPALFCSLKLGGGDRLWKQISFTSSLLALLPVGSHPAN